VTTAGSLKEYNAGPCPLSEVYLIYMMLQDWALLSSQVDCCYYTNRFLSLLFILILMAMVGTEPGAF
jgi:hypothetical protein